MQFDEKGRLFLENWANPSREFSQAPF